MQLHHKNELMTMQYRFFCDEHYGILTDAVTIGHFRATNLMAASIKCEWLANIGIPRS
jgi:hypothetical protein